jgi:hypothetical protein
MGSESLYGSFSLLCSDSFIAFNAKLNDNSQIYILREVGASASKRDMRMKENVNSHIFIVHETRDTYD